MSNRKQEYVIYCHYEKDYIMASECDPCEECFDNYKIPVQDFVAWMNGELNEETTS